MSNRTTPTFDLFEWFPHEVIFIIFSHLGGQELGRLAQINREHYEVLREKTLWRDLFLQHHGYKLLFVLQLYRDPNSNSNLNNNNNNYRDIEQYQPILSRILSYSSTSTSSSTCPPSVRLLQRSLAETYISQTSPSLHDYKPLLKEVWEDILLREKISNGWKGLYIQAYSIPTSWQTVRKIANELCAR